MHFFIILFSPVLTSRNYTPTSGLHYFPNPSPTLESQMWSSTNTNTDDYDRPKSGALPDFQRLTNSHYATNGRAYINYNPQVVSSLHKII